ncbi:DUF805 domain-containing protein [Maricaulis parjimensis]|uniref:DUF805 domain-containing protein n=1 Tax=Maricaulis parjimensis TaxID=144023 RepID=UPI001939FD8D|nr:DUF805 domain-containing protein [Maricaulis parjimensis]
MDYQYVLLNPNGRIAPRDYWIGVLIIFGGNLASGLVPLLGGLVWLGLIWVGICVYGKRLHDTGRSAWLHLIPWGVSLVTSLISGIILGGAILAAILAGENVNVLSLLAAGGVVSGLAGLSTLVWLGYTLWLGLAEGQAGANAYGPAPIRIIDVAPAGDE